MKHSATLLVVAALLTPRESYAQFVVEAPATDTLLSSTVSELTELLALETMEAADIASTVSNLVSLLRTANESLAVARKVKEAYETLRDYSPEDLKRDALGGLYDAMPELKDGIEELEMFVQQGGMIGGNDFWSYRNIHDTRMNNYLKGVAELGLKGTVYPALFSSVGMDEEATTDSDKLVALHFARRGQILRRAQRAAAKGYVANKIDALVNQAEEGDQLDLQIEAVGTQAMVSAEGHLELLWAAKHEEIADGVRRQLAREQADAASRKQLSDNTGDMFEIGVIE